ncbi:radical SAM protein [Candidatus Thorarchaeota archaeon]|nr:MAG: radical SAM protein [Candidatus Thorarchaeota archaeon]
MPVPEYQYTVEDLNWVPKFMEEVKDYFYSRPEDNLLILRPNKVMHLNKTGMLMLKMLLKGEGPESVVKYFTENHDVERQKVLNDLAAFVDDLQNMVSGNQNIYTYRTAKVVPFGTGEIKYPVLSEIAVTYRCNNKCRFCYAYSPYRESEEMTTDEIKKVMDIIADDAHVPSLSFTGGEPTLRDDLFQLTRYGREKGLRMNLITNGRRCSDKDFVSKLVEAGLNSAQVSIEGPDPETHDYIVGAPGAFEQTVKGIKNLRETDIYTHCNTTICRPNVDKLEELVDFHADELGLTYFSMNMVIYTGTAAKLREELQIKYTEIGDIVRRVKKRASKKGVQFVWYAPTPVCVFNPIAHGLGAKSCACCDGLLSVDAEGNLLPCSSFSEPVGDLLHDGFEKVWYNRAAKFWRAKDYAPEGCKACEYFDYCFGGCPLYWDVHGYDEIEEFWPEKSRVASKVDEIRLNLRRRIRGDQHGIT